MTAPQTHRAFLFSGHMIDRPGRVPPRFPASREHAAERAIAGVLDELEASAGDPAICSAAAGGDILFAEACLDRGMAVRLCLPLPEPEFISRSVGFAGAGWTARFRRLLGDDAVVAEYLPAVAPDQDPFAACNEWMIRAALDLRAARTNCIALWDGKASTGVGTDHMVRSATAQGIRVRCIDPAELKDDLNGAH